MRPRISIRGCVRPLVRPSVRWSEMLLYKVTKTNIHSETTSKVTMKVFLTCPEDLFVRQFDRQTRTHRFTHGLLVLLINDPPFLKVSLLEIMLESFRGLIRDARTRVRTNGENNDFPTIFNCQWHCDGQCDAMRCHAIANGNANTPIVCILSFSSLRTRTFDFFLLLLDATSHLYKRVCPSVGPSVGPSVRPSVGHAFVKIAENRAFLHESLLQPIRNVEKWLINHQHPKSDANNNHTRLFWQNFMKKVCLLVHYIDWSDLNRLELTWTDFKLT